LAAEAVARAANDATAAAPRLKNFKIKNLLQWPLGNGNDKFEAFLITVLRT
jgi:hypothetical protein